MLKKTALLILLIISGLQCYSQSYFMKKTSNHTAASLLKYNDHSLLLVGGYDTYNSSISKVDIDTGAFGFNINLYVTSMGTNMERVGAVSNDEIFIIQNSGGYTMGGLFNYSSVIFSIDSTAAINWSVETDEIYDIINVFSNGDSTFTLFGRKDPEMTSQNMVVGKVGKNILTPDFYTGELNYFKAVIKNLDGNFTATGLSYDSTGWYSGIFEMDTSFNFVAVKQIVPYPVQFIDLVQLKDKSYVIIADKNDSTVIFHLDSLYNNINSFEIADHITNRHLRTNGSDLFLSYQLTNKPCVLNMDSALNIISSICIADSSEEMTMVDCYVSDNFVYFAVIENDTIMQNSWLIKTDFNLSELCYYHSVGLNIDTITTDVKSKTCTLYNESYFGNFFNYSINSSPDLTWNDSCVMIPTIINKIEVPKALPYPNPANEKLFLNCQENEYVIITSITGTIVYENKKTTSDLELNTSTLPGGMYFLQRISPQNNCLRFMVAH